jgi:hypothetical protein
LTIWKKAISAATSAALLASLLAPAGAPAAFAEGSVVSSGSTVVGNTSANAFTLTLSENSVAAATGGVITVTLDTGVTYSGTVSVTSGSASVAISSKTVAGGVLTFTASAGNSTFLDTIVISSKIAVGAGVTPGAIHATVAGATGYIAGSYARAGTLSSLYAIGATSVVVNNAGCAFVASIAVTIGGDDYTTGTVSLVDGGLQTLGLSAALRATYASGTAVSQTTSVLCYASEFAVGTAVKGLMYWADSQNSVSADRNNQHAGDLGIAETNAGALAHDAVLTFAITTPGVTLSGIRPTASWSSGGGSLVSGTASVDTTTWRTFSFTVNAASTSATSGDFLTVSGIYYDVAASVPAGTQIEVSLANSGAVPQDATSASNAIVGYQIAAVASTPTVYIGFNAQNTGMVTLTERGPGYFTASSGNNNEFWVCSPSSDETITTAPWAVVASPVAGSLTLVSPSTGLPVSVAKGVAFGTDCFVWSVYGASTVASTIQILGTNATNTAPLAAAAGNGLQVNVPSGVQPGPTYVTVATGNHLGSSVTSQSLTVAYRAFKNQLTIAAASAPWMAIGSLNNPAGNLILTETQVGQLSAGDDICVDVHDTWDVDFGALNTSAQPLAVADTNVSGLIVGPVAFSWGYDCLGQSIQVGATNATAVAFHFPIVQGSTSAHGTVTISNIKYNVWKDATPGIVALDVYVVHGVLQQSQGFVTNANIGVPAKLSIGAVSALGLNPTSGYTAKTPKTQAVGKYVTWKFTGGTALAGQRVNVLVATKVGGAWTGPKYLKSAWADANGIVTVSMKSASAAAVNVRVQWPGSSSYSVSTSKALGAYWK